METNSLDELPELMTDEQLHAHDAELMADLLGLNDAERMELASRLRESLGKIPSTTGPTEAGIRRRIIALLDELTASRPAQS